MGSIEVRRWTVAVCECGASAILQPDATIHAPCDCTLREPAKAWSVVEVIDTATVGTLLAAGADLAESVGAHEGRISNRRLIAWQEAVSAALPNEEASDVAPR